MGGDWLRQKNANPTRHKNKQVLFCSALVFFVTLNKLLQLGIKNKQDLFCSALVFS